MTQLTSKKGGGKNDTALLQGNGSVQKRCRAPENRRDSNFKGN